jgi:two-component system sensor histidine kinase/response regulator
VIGVLSADYKYSERPVTAHDAGQMLMFATMVGMTIENVRLYEDMERRVAQRTAELSAAMERARLADQRKSEFLASLSHELRTPLNAIIGFSTVLIDELDGPLTALQHEDLTSINLNGRYLLHMIDELLDMARIEAGHLDLEPEPLDLQALTHSVVDMIQALVRNKNIQLYQAIPPDLPLIYADADRVRQVLLNLLANAFKFTDAGSVTISARCLMMAGATPSGSHRADGLRARNLAGAETITLPAVQDQPWIAISVSDTGIGISADQLPFVFDEFHQAHGRRSRQRGSGLGLSITRRLVEAHKGRIWVESVPGRGSTFTFTLPVTNVEREA